jgi:large subunit ribosomal protein L35
VEYGRGAGVPRPVLPLRKFANSGCLCHNPRARRPADQGLPWRRRSAQEHDPEKWIPVFGIDHAQMQLSTDKEQRDRLNDRRRRFGGVDQESKMPKMKTKSGAKKRFKVTASGKVLYAQSRKRHGMIKRTKKQIRQLRGTNVLFKTDGDNVKKYFLPNG